MYTTASAISTPGSYAQSLNSSAIVSSPASSVASLNLKDTITTSPPQNPTHRVKRVSLSQQRMKTLSNPVDDAIINSMLQSVKLDVLSGYAKEKVVEVKQLTGSGNLLEGQKKGYALLREPVLYKGELNIPK